MKLHRICATRTSAYLFALVGLDDKGHYNGGPGTLKWMLQQNEKAPLVRPATAGEGTWRVRDDVFYRFQTAHAFKQDPLTVGFTGYQGKYHIGPEFQVGHVVGDYFTRVDWNDPT